jgi:hypothetical protein
MVVKYIYIADDETEFTDKQDFLDYEKFCEKFKNIHPKLMSYGHREFWKDGKLVYRLSNVVSPSEIPDIWRKFLQLTLEFVDRFLPSSKKLIERITGTITEPTWENFGRYPINIFKDIDDEEYKDWSCVLVTYLIVSSLDPKTGDLYYNRFFYGKTN